MIKPETNDFFGNELDKAKLEIVSYWKDKYKKTQEALDIAKDALKRIESTKWYDSMSSYEEMTFTADKALEQITALEQKE